MTGEALLTGELGFAPDIDADPSAFARWRAPHRRGLRRVGAGEP